MALPSLLDPLCCQEEDPFSDLEEIEPLDPLFEQEYPNCPSFLSSLFSNEQNTHPNFSAPSSLCHHPYLHSARRAAVQWAARAAAGLGFAPLTLLLAVNYLDRCFLSPTGLQLQEDKPWMNRLSIVACLSLAAKIEETNVPFLLDLQTAVEEATGFVFESKTIKRMELLVLSTLNWRMNSVTPLHFIAEILGKLENENQMEVLRRCERVLVSVVDDWRWVQFPPSVWAAAAVVHAVGRQQVDETVLNASKERVEECHGVILELVGSGGENKRKNSYSDPPSPNGVIGFCFSCDSSSSSGDSMAMWPSSVSSSPEQPLPKRPKCSII